MTSPRDRIVELRRVPANELRANPKNWRRHPEAQRRAMRDMLGSLGFAAAAIARETADGLELIDGHLRQEIAGDALVPVLVLDVDEAEAEQLLVSLDPLAAMAVADDEALAALLSTVEIPAVDLVAFLAGKGGRRGKTDPDDVPPVPVTPTTRAGDLWLLGEHRVLCGDATDPAAAARLLDGETPSLMLTDPPYNVGLDYGEGVEDRKPVDEYETWTRAWFELWAGLTARQIVTPGGNNLVLWLRAFEPYHVAPWTKTNAMTHGKVAQWLCWEPVLFYGAGWNRERPNDVFDYPVGDQSSDGIGDHPCPKPAVFWHAVLAQYGDGAVVDPFLGSGTTLIVAEQAGMRCFGVELSPHFVDVAVARWEAFTGKTATLAKATRKRSA